MSRATVRAAVAAYLAPAAVPGLNVVLETQPKDLGGIEFTSGAPGEVNGAVAFVFIGGQHEEAVVWDGAGGGRQTTYTTELRVFHRSLEPTADAAMKSFDAVIDAACTRLRSDPWMGLGQTAAVAQGLISSAHEGLSVEFGDPELGTPDGGWIETWAILRFPVLEWNQPT